MLQISYRLFFRHLCDKPMQVVQQTLRLLTLRERPIGLWILSIVTATVGLSIFISSNPPIDWFGLFCITCADLIVFISPVKTCRFDKYRNRVTLKQRGWLGTQVISCPIDEVTGVQVESLNVVGLQFYRLSLSLLEGKRFYLTPIPSTDSQLQQKLAKRIEQFLSGSS